MILVFCSVEFLLYFLPVFFCLYRVTPKQYKNITLLVGSLVFYALGDPKYLLVLVISILINYGVAGVLGSSYEKKSAVFLLAMVGNISVLFGFKLELLGNALPLGISFYTFQMMSYLIDVYRGEIVFEPSLLKMATYVTMFPQLVAGPIVNYSEVSDALNHRKMSLGGFKSGLQIFTFGLAAKVLLADMIGILWNDIQVRGFDSISTSLAWLGAFAYSFKLYFDFYGYSLMAIGLGRMMGFELPKNFKHPYMARSVREFYRRWHVTLGRWFCKYVYIPLGGNREGALCTARNLLVVWALTGLWHGGRGNYILWGVLLWGIIMVEKLLDGFGKELRSQLTIFPHLYLWVVIPVTWMCFAIPDVKELGTYLGRMMGMRPAFPVAPGDFRNALGQYGILFVLCLVSSTPLVENLYRRWKNSLVADGILAVLFWVCVYRIITVGNNPFMYFKF